MILYRWHCQTCGDQVLVLVDADDVPTCMCCGLPVASLGFPEPVLEEAR